MISENIWEISSAPDFASHWPVLLQGCPHPNPRCHDLVTIIVMMNMSTASSPFPPMVIIMTMMGKVMTWTLPPLSGGTAGHSGRRYSCNSFVIIIMMIAMLIVTMMVMMINIIIIMAMLTIRFFLFCIKVLISCDVS